MARIVRFSDSDYTKYKTQAIKRGGIGTSSSKYLMVCEQCGEGFHASRDHAQHCSNACTQKAYRERKPKKANLPRQCDYCEKQYQPKRSHSKFCSKKCNVYNQRRLRKAIPPVQYR